MAQFYRVTEASKMGEPWSAHGNEIQTWWCKVEGVDKGVSIGKKVGTDVQPGTSMYGDLISTVSKKGNEFMKFKGAQVPDGIKPPAGGTSPIASNAGEMLTLLRDIQRRLKVLMGEEASVQDFKNAKEDKVKEVADEVKDEITLDDIPF